MRKCLDVQPFNEIWYENCYYAAFFPVIQYFNGYVESFMYNLIGAYQYENHELTYQYIFQQQFLQILKQNGIKRALKDVSAEEILETIKADLNENKVVILPIDCFYESIRPEIYQKEHYFHYVTIYGYDDETKQVDLIEHQYKISMKFYKQSLSYQDVKNCYKGFLNGEKPENDWRCYQAFEQIGVSQVPDFFEILSQKNQERKNGIDALEQFYSDLILYSQDEGRFQEQAGRLKSIVKKIVESKKYERYCIMKQLPESICSFADVIYADWNIIRGLIQKYCSSGLYRKKDVELCAVKLKEIIMMEKRYLELTLNYVQQAKSYSGYSEKV